MDKGIIFRRVNRLGGVWGEGITPKAVWHVVKAAAKLSDIKGLAPHDLRRYAPVSVTWPEANWNRFSFFWAMPRSKRPSDTSAASKSCDMP